MGLPCLFQKDCLLFSFFKSGLFNSLPSLWVSKTSAETLPHTNRSEPRFPPQPLFTHQPSCAWYSSVPFDRGVRASFHFILLCWTSRFSISLLLLLWKMQQLVQMILKINLKKNFSCIFCFFACLFSVSFHFCWNTVELLFFRFFSYVGHYRLLSRVPCAIWAPQVP